NVDLDGTPFLRKVAAAVAPAAEIATAGSGGSAAAASTTGAAAPATAPTGALVEPAGESGEAPHDPATASTHRRQLFLTNAIAELTNAMLEKAPINDMFAMVMEAFYRGLGFSHVLFLMRDPKTRSFRTRFGFGAGLETLQERFVYSVGNDDDIFAQATRRARNAVIIDTTDARYAATIPDWCRNLTAPHSILLFAVVVNKVCIGLIYADTCSDRLRINAQELKLLNTLVKQLTLGINQR
ncbi:MAG: hypothetical protein RLW62_13470, partial [Gammaproteobacteria bacterium]